VGGAQGLVRVAASLAATAAAAGGTQEADVAVQEEALAVWATAAGLGCAVPSLDDFFPSLCRAMEPPSQLDQVPVGVWRQVGSLLGSKAPAETRLRSLLNSNEPAETRLKCVQWRQTAALYSLIDVLVAPTSTPTSTSTSTAPLCSPSSAAAAVRSAAAWLACCARVRGAGTGWYHAPAAAVRAQGAVLHTLASAAAAAAAEEAEAEAEAESEHSPAAALRNAQLPRLLRDCGLLMADAATTPPAVRAHWVTLRARWVDAKSSLG
jgi:hypothetical protein